MITNTAFSRIRTLLAAIAFSATGSTYTQELLTGDTRLACEAIMCLAAGSQPSECTPAIQRYFSIVRKKFSETLKARSDFLQMCPAANQSTEMQSLVAAQANGAGMCDAVYLNQILRVNTGQDLRDNFISNQMPANCAAYIGHAYSGRALPKYVGLPERGGNWVEQTDYPLALQAYNARIQAEDLAAAETAKAVGAATN